MNPQKIKKRLQISIAIIWGSIILGGLLWAGFYVLENGIDAGKEAISNIISNSEGNAPLVFLGLFFVRGLFFIPSTVLILVAGALFDPIDAVILSIVGQMSSSVLIYVIAQFIGREFILAHENDFFKRIDKAISKKGFFTTLVLSIIPIVPADTVSVVAAITGISFADYLLGMFLGSLAFILPFVFLGQSLSSSQGLIITIPLFAILISITFWAWKHPHFRGFFKNKDS